MDNFNILPELLNIVPLKVTLGDIRQKIATSDVAIDFYFFAFHNVSLQKAF